MCYYNRTFYPQTLTLMGTQRANNSPKWFCYHCRNCFSSSPSIHDMPSISFTYQQYQTSVRHQRCFPSMSFPCIFHCYFLILHPHLLPSITGAKPLFTSQHIPVNRTSVTDYTSACRPSAPPAASLSLIAAPQPHHNSLSTAAEKE